MKKKILSMALAAVLMFGLAAPAVAAGQTFSDVPSSYWGYADIEAAAAAGLMNGTGNGKFSPNKKVSVAQFLTLLGRLVFPDTKVTEGDTWFGPYVSAAQSAGLLTGTQVNVNDVEAGISRYDMAVILRAAAKKLGVTEKAAQRSEVTDFGMVPNMYTEAVLAVYGMGLIKGDQNGNFNGSNTMMRAEVATVIMRLAKAKPGSSSQSGVTDPQPTTGPEKPTDVAYSLSVGGGYNTNGVLVPGETVIINFSVAPSSASAPYGNDRTGFIYTSSDPSVLELTGKASSVYDHWYVTAHREGTATITVTDPYGVTGSRDFTVVSARDGLGTKTYAVSVTGARQERHSLRGEAHTEMDFIPDVPYKIYYTRDGGKTSQVVYEGVAPSGGDTERIKIELPEDAFYSKDAGLYISGEATLNGQRLVTSDLRTDGRAYANVVHNISEPNDKILSRLEFVLTPPTGEKAKYTVSGLVFYGGSSGSPVSDGFVVQLHLKDGRVVGEATTDANGEFSMDCEVDALDSGFNPYLEQYYSTAIGMQGGVQMEGNGRRKNGELLLWSMDDINANPYSTAHISSGLLVEVK